MQDARAREKEFFLSKPEYADLPNFGTGYLSEKLSAHLINEIMKNLPSIQSYIESTISKTQAELTALGGDVAGTRGSMLHMVLQLCHKLEKAFDKIVDGGKDGEARARGPQQAQTSRHHMPDAGHHTLLTNSQDGIATHMALPRYDGEHGGMLTSSAALRYMCTLCRRREGLGRV